MGKAARNRRRRKHGRGQPDPGDAGPLLRAIAAQDPDAVGPAPGGSAEAREAVMQVEQQTEMPCRATYLDDPMFGVRAAQVTGLTATGHLIADPDQPMDQIPVLLFEPARQTILEDKTTGLLQDVRTEMMISLGFHRVPPRFVVSGLPADGWGVYRVPGGVVLRDAEGAIRAEGKLDLDPEWISAVASFRAVLVFVGPKLGIRVISGQPTYTDTARAAEFRSGRRDGLLLSAMVSWRGDLDEATGWQLLSSAVLGLPGPAIFVPWWAFRSSGGPVTFGFAPFVQQDSSLMAGIPVARDLIGELTETDFDLNRPDREADLSMVAGYHAPPGDRDFTVWRKQALQAGEVLVIAGRRQLPWHPDGASEQQAMAVLRDAEAAIVPLSAASLRAGGVAERDQALAGIGPCNDAENQEYAQVLTAKLRAQSSFSAYMADEVAALIGLEKLKSWVVRLWPVVCQTCEEPLGENADLSADGYDDGVRLSLNHSVCRPSGADHAGLPLRLPTSSFAIGSLSSNPEKPRRGDIPVVVINPSCEQLLARQDASTWRDATLDEFAGLGLRPFSRKLPPHIASVRAELRDERLELAITAGQPDQYQWEIHPPAAVLDQLRRHRGLVIAVSTKVLPSLLLPHDLPAVIADPDTLTGWADLTPASAPRRARPEA